MLPLRTYMPAPVPPPMVKDNEACPAGTSNFQYCCEPDAPEAVTVTPLVNATGAALTVNVNVVRCATEPIPVIVIG